MTEKIPRKKRLPAFRINLDQLELLVEKLIKRFGADPVLTIYITINPDEEYIFNSVTEMRRLLPEYISKIKHFDIELRSSQSYSQYCQITSRSGPIFLSFAEISASSELEGWGAGMIDIALTFITRRCKCWYSFLTGWFPWVAQVLLLCFLPLFIFLPLIDFSLHPKWFYPLIIIWIMIGLIFFFPSYFSPNAILEIKENKSFFRKYEVELKLLIAFISPLIPSIPFIIKALFVK